LLGTLSIVAGAVAAFSGFGIGSLLTPVLMLSMPTSQAVAVLSIPHAWATFLRFLKLQHDVHMPTFRQFGVASALGGLVGAALQSSIGSRILTVILAILLILAGSSEIARRPIPIPHNGFWRLVGGGLSGLFGGLVGNQGGIRAAALLGFGLSANAFVATATASALMVDATRVPMYLATSGSVIIDSMATLLLAATGVTIGTLIGVPILGRIPKQVYRPLIGGLLVLLGAGLIGVAI
jgi:uncharacterized membrane protein YfcA